MLGWPQAFFEELHFRIIQVEKTLTRRNCSFSWFLACLKYLNPHFNSRNTAAPFLELLYETN